MAGSTAHESLWRGRELMDAQYAQPLDLDELARGVSEGWQTLLQLESQAEGSYPCHAARADAYERALALCSNSAERAYLQRRPEEMLKEG